MLLGIQESRIYKKKTVNIYIVLLYTMLFDKDFKLHKININSKTLLLFEITIKITSVCC